MTTTVTKSILRGRPLGGCVILVNNELIAAAKPILLSERIVIITLANLSW